MSDYGDSRFRIYNGLGVPLAEMNVPVRVVWSLNEQGSGEFHISARYDAKARRDLLKPGNLVLFEHARLGGWGGVIVPHDGMEWQGDGLIVVRMRESMFQFARRRAPLFNWAPLYKLVKGFLAELIFYANLDEDARLREGNLQPSNKSNRMVMNDAMLSDILANVSKSGRNYVYTEPGFDEQNLLIFKVNMVPGAKHLASLDGASYYALQEDVNIETPNGTFYREGGELVNDLMVRNDAEEDGKIVRVRVEDDASIRQYYRWQGVKYYGIEDEDAMRVRADKDIVEFTKFHHAVMITAIESPESPDTFSHLRIGRLVRVLLHSVGFYNGERGVDLLGQIMALEYDSEERRCIVSVEVIE